MPITFCDLPDLDARDLPASRRSPASSPRTRSSGRPSRASTAACCSGRSASLAPGMTAFYMFRLVFMTFYGECRARPSHATEHHRTSRRRVDDHAAESSLAGARRWSAARCDAGRLSSTSLGGSAQPRSRHWLAPVFDRRTSAASSCTAAEYTPRRTARRARLEYLLMALSVAGRARRHPASPALMYIDARRCRPGRFSEAWPAARSIGRCSTSTTSTRSTRRCSSTARWLLSRAAPGSTAYVIDGIVNGAATVTRWSLMARRRCFDRYVVDGCVNCVADVTHWIGGARAPAADRAASTAYLYVIVIGVVVVMMVARLLWAEARTRSG